MGSDCPIIKLNGIDSDLSSHQVNDDLFLYLGPDVYFWLYHRTLWSEICPYLRTEGVPPLHHKDIVT
jgi:hypothetical protein